jgi:hypothetical protein
VSVNVRPHVSTRWLHELAIPGKPDISSVYASYAFAGVTALGLLLGQATDLWPLFTLGILGVACQLPLLIGVVLAKIRTSLAPSVGHAKMFPQPEPLEEIGWLKAFRGFITTAIVVMAFYLYERGGAV